MSQTQITLNPQLAPLADELMQITGVTNLSNLFSLLLTRYGSHLKNSWVISSALPSMVNVSQRTSASREFSPSVESSSTWEFPIEAEDPIIRRIAQLVEDF